MDAHGDVVEEAGEDLSGDVIFLTGFWIRGQLCEHVSFSGSGQLSPFPCPAPARKCHSGTGWELRTDGSNSYHSLYPRNKLADLEPGALEVPSGDFPGWIFAR